MQIGNLFERLPLPTAEEAVQELSQSAHGRIERIVSHGHCSPPGFWYDQAENEWVMLVQGEARVRFEPDDQVVHLRAGDYLNIPAKARHRVEWTVPGADTVWLAVFY